MKDKFKMQFMLFNHIKLVFGFYIIICIIPPLCSVFFLNIDADCLFIFHLFVRFLFYFSVGFGIITYLLLTMDKRNKLYETIQIIKKNEYRNLMLVLIMILFIIFNLIVFISLILAGAKTGSMSFMIELIRKYYFMNILLPQICFTIIVILVSQIPNLKISFIMFILIIFLTSSYSEGLVSMQKPSIPIDLYINYLRKPFAFFYQNAEMSIDSLYGFQNEMYKLISMFFWIGLLIIYFVKEILKRRTIILAMLLSVILGCVFIPESMLRVDGSWYNTYADFNEYGVLEDKCGYIKEEGYPYHVDSYDLDIKVRRQLEVTGHIKIISDKPMNEYFLTLYHDYKVESIECNDKMTYKQNHDYITLNFDKPIKEFEIKISYAGFHPMLYSNYQASLLPGYFPWYPKEGKKQCYVTMSDSSISMYGYNPYNKESHALYRVRVYTRYPIVTNLQDIDKNVYQGYSDGLTILGGFVDKIDHPIISNYYPLYFGRYIEEEDIISYENEYKDIDNQMNNLFGYKSDLLDKKAIIASNGLTQTLLLGKFSEFEDYNFIGNNGHLSINDYISYILFEKENIDPILRDIIIISIRTNQTKDEFVSDVISTIEQQIEFLSYGGDAEKGKIGKYKSLEDNINEDVKNLGVDNYLLKISKELGLSEHDEHTD